MIPDEARFARTARAWGVTPWELERALEEDPRAFRWWLMGGQLEDFEATIRTAGGPARG